MRHALYLPLFGLVLAPGAALAQTGIGTTTPDPKAALDITATDKGLLTPRLTSTQRHAISAPPRGLLVFQTGPDSVGFWYATGAGPQWRFVPDQASAADNLGNHTATQNLDLAGNLLVGSGGASGLGINTAGYVGIGAPTPTTRLTITPNAVEPKITLWNGGSVTDHYGFGVSGAQLNYHVANTGASHVFSATGLNGDGREVMRIRGNGRVGIGTTNPFAALHVRDTASNSSTIGYFEGNNSFYAGAYVNAMKATASPFWGYQRQGNIVGWTHLSPTNDWNLVLLKGPNNFFVPLTVTDSTGSVGIGTTTPRQQLHVYSTKPGTKIRLQSGAPGNFGPTGIEFWSDPVNTAAEWRPSMIRSVDQGPGTWTGGLAFYVNGAGFAQRRDSIEVMRLTNNKVGIGTAAPIGKLHLVTDNSNGGSADDYLFDSYGDNADEGLFLRKARGTVAAPQNLQAGDRIGTLAFVPRLNNLPPAYFTGSQIQAFYLGDGTNALSDLRFYTSGQTEQMRISETGNVGIGAAVSPATRLTITPFTTEPKITLWNGGNIVHHYGFGVSGNQLNYHVFNTAANHVFFAGGRNGDGAELMRIRGNGRVGIGTANPFTALHVRDTVSVNTSVAYFEGNNSVYAGAYVNAIKATARPFWGYQRQGSIVGWEQISPTNDWNLILLKSPNAFFAPLTVTDSTGYMGLGIATPRTRLSLNPTVVEPKITLWDGGSSTSHYGFGVSGFQLNYHVNAATDNHVFYAGGKNGDGTELLRITGAGAVRVAGLGGGGQRLLTVDNAGNLVAATSTPAGQGDDLGDHVATQNLDLATNKLVGNGGSTGLRINSIGAVSTDGALNVGATLTTTGAATVGTALSAGGAITAGGDVTIPAANNYKYAAARTYSATLGFADFTPEAYTSKVMLDVSAELYFDATSTTATARAALHLPQGATLTGLTMSAFDNVAANASAALRVYNISSRVITTLGTATTAATPGYTTVTPAISTAVVDNAANVYYVVFSLPSAANGNSLTLQAVRVTYTVTQAE